MTKADDAYVALHEAVTEYLGCFVPDALLENEDTNFQVLFDDAVNGILSDAMDVTHDVERFCRELLGEDPDEGGGDSLDADL